MGGGSVMVASIPGRGPADERGAEVKPGCV